MKAPDHISELLLKQFDTSLTAEEQQQLNNWLNQSAHNRGFYAEINDEEQLRQMILAASTSRNAGGRVLSRLKQELFAEAPTVHRIPLFRRWWVAASVLLVLATGAYLWISSPSQPAPQPELTQFTDIPAGKEGAILTLADGSQILLDSVQNSTIALQGGVVARVTDGRLVYEGKGNEVVYNTINTPRGRQYHVTLPDGTGVWLNAASSIRYPTVFAGNERNVQVTGEAYFEVATNAEMPFRAMVSNIAAIEVLGTHFNINAYDNETSINTTLLEGSVRVNGTKIRPGQQAQIAVSLSPNGQMASSQRVRVINDADVDKVMAWKNGLINFEGVTFDAIMRQLERWYDIQVVYENNIIPATQLAGKMTRGVSLNGLLKNLEALDVHYRLDGKKLIILQ